MPEIYTITWNGDAVGEIKNITRDMWYVEGYWTSYNSPASIEFEKWLRNGNAKAFFKDPETHSLRAILNNKDDVGEKLYCLIIHLDIDNTIFLRQVFDQKAINHFFYQPQQPNIISYILSIFKHKK